MEALWSQHGVGQLIAGGTPLLLIVARTLAVYIVMVLGLRFSGKREIGQFTSFDLVVVLLIANAVQNAMVGPDNTLMGGLVAAVTLLAANWAVGRVVDTQPRVRRVLLGEPRVLVSEGTVIEANLRREDLTHEELAAAIREHGFENTSDVRLAVLEIDGTISVVPMDATVLRSHRRVKALRHVQ
ncbi:MAG TPA: YetF domain-containing protein [Coriobacteriia bacterium]|nr:YetF domain-containing protein [Coriobacteriia bacterium]